jgi:hypothetical protein
MRRGDKRPVASDAHNEHDIHKNSGVASASRNYTVDATARRRCRYRSQLSAIEADWSIGCHVVFTHCRSGVAKASPVRAFIERCRSVILALRFRGWCERVCK